MRILRDLLFLGLFLSFFLSSLLAQNLILNPSFEQFKKCPKMLDDPKIRLGKEVKVIKGTPDLFHSCNAELAPQLNPLGRQIPADGETYVGMTLTSDSRNGECAQRDFIELQLKEPLVAGEKYLFSIKTSLADSSGYFTDQIGVHFYSRKWSKKQSVRSLLGKASISNLADTF